MPPNNNNAPVPSEEAINQLIELGMESVAQSQIDFHKLPYEIVNGKCVLKLVGTEFHLKRFITFDSEMLQVKQDVTKLANCPHEILITGETGTGKEIIARSMIGDRKGSFTRVNCAGLPETLVESELFGHKKGAFTGADGDRQGLMATARDGVFFLDEIGELPLTSQGKLLCALQDKRIRRVGGREEEEINCKFVCATNRNIKEMVEAKQFRRDLYARISTFEIHLKPLKQRATDIVPLIQSLQGGANFLKALAAAGKDVRDLNLDLNVRSLQQYVVRYNILGRIII